MNLGRGRTLDVIVRTPAWHVSGQALPGLSVVFEQMGKETCSLNIVISSLVDITTKLELWSGRHMVAQENCAEKDKRIDS